MFFETHRSCFEYHEMRYEKENFCFIQSNGIGKIKLLYEYKRVSFEKNHVASSLILPSSVMTDQQEQVKGIFESLYLGRAPPTPQTIDHLDSNKASLLVAAVIFATLDKKLEGARYKSQEEGFLKNVRKSAILFD